MSNKYVPDQSYCACNKGSAPSVFALSSKGGVQMYSYNGIGTEVERGFPSMGTCALQGSVCSPQIQEWYGVKEGVKVNGSRLVMLEKSAAHCIIGGVVRIFSTEAEAKAYAGNTVKKEEKKPKHVPWYKKVWHFLEKAGGTILKFDEGVLKGEWKELKNLGGEAINIVKHPIDTTDKIAKGVTHIVLEVVDDVEHPIRTAEGVYKSGKKIVVSAVNLAEHPDKIAKKAVEVGKYVINNPEQAGEAVGKALPIVALTVATDGVFEAAAAADAAEVAAASAEAAEAAVDSVAAGKRAEEAAVAAAKAQASAERAASAAKTAEETAQATKTPEAIAEASKQSRAAEQAEASAKKAADAADKAQGAAESKGGGSPQPPDPNASVPDPEGKVTDGEPSDNSIEDDAQKPDNGVDKSGEGFAEPVDPITGHVFYNATDFELSGPIPIKWERAYNSGSCYTGILGYGISSPYDITLIEGEDKLEIIRKDGTAIALSIPDHRPSYHVAAQVKVEKEDSSYKVFMFKERLEYRFTKIESGLYKPISIRDERGFSIALQFSGNKLLRMIDSAGRTLKISSNSRGFITKISIESPSELRTLVEYQYNIQGNLVGILDGLKQKTVIEYDDKQRMIRKTDRNGQSFYWQYNTKGQCIHTWGDGGLFEGSLEYFSDKTLTTDNTGLQEEYYYNKAYKNTQLKDSYGNSKFYEYDQKGLLITFTDEEALSILYKYDDRGNLIKTTFPDGRVFSFVYDEENRLILNIDASGNQKVWVYGENGRLLSYRFGESVSYFEYNSLNLVTKIQNDSGETILLKYDEFHNLIQMTTPCGCMREWRYNSFGKCIETKDLEGHTRFFHYDGIGRLNHIQLPGSEVLDLQYDAYDNILKINDAHNTICFTYTALGKIKSREENGVKVSYDYDQQERLKSLTNEYGEHYHFIRNKRGEVIQEISFDGITKYYHRDRAGKVIEVRGETGKRTQYQYDRSGRIIRADYPEDGYWESFEYNKGGLLIRATTPDNEVRLVRDGYGRVIIECQGEHTLHYDYDKKGGLVSIKSSLGADITYGRNPVGQIASIRAGVEKDAWFAHMGRNAQGLEVERCLPEGLKSRWSYDKGNNPIRQSVVHEQKELLDRRYQWDVNQQLHQITNQLTGGVIEFGYDAFYSLAWSQYEDGEKEYKLLDKGGCIFGTKERTDRIYGKSGKLLQDENWYYSYDGEGNLKRKTKKRELSPGKGTHFDEKAEIRRYSNEEIQEYKVLRGKIPGWEETWQLGDWFYTWQVNGMLKSVKTPEGSIITFEYDALGRRTSKEVISDSGEAIKNYHFVWDGDVLLHEWSEEQKKESRLSLDSQGGVIHEAESPENIITWVYESGSLVPCARLQGPESYSIISDYIGRPIEAYNHLGNKVWEADYDIYGQLRNLKGDPSFIPFRQLGQYEDQELGGLYYNRYRYYDSDQGNYISQDPIGLQGNNPTLYAYVYDSNTQIDPMGLATQLTFFADKVPGGTVGHSFIGITVDGGATSYIGQWPVSMPEGSFKEEFTSFFKGVPGKLKYVDTSHLGRRDLVSRTFDLTDEQSVNLEKYILDFHKGNAAPNSYRWNRHCTTFACGAAKATGIEEMQLPWYKVNSPENLAEQIRRCNARP